MRYTWIIIQKIDLNNTIYGKFIAFRIFLCMNNILSLLKK